MSGNSVKIIKQEVDVSDIKSEEVSSNRIPGEYAPHTGNTDSLTDSDLEKPSVKSDDGPEYYGCPICEDVFSSKQSCVEHILEHTGNNELTPVKQEIDTDFNERDSSVKVKLKTEELIKQELISDDDKKHGIKSEDIKPGSKICPICGSVFFNDESFFDHIKDHRSCVVGI